MNNLSIVIMVSQVCVLFNIAALSTQIAETQNLDSEDGLQKANKKLQSAAGIFTALKEIVVGLIELVIGTTIFKTKLTTLSRSQHMI
jgi:programmed cell death 6-interacting protein